MNVKLIAHTPEPEKVIACAAKLCYQNSDPQKLMDGLTDEKAGNFVNMLASMSHTSPTEHASFTFQISGVSRSFLAQITRHRIASFSVRSQRYCSMDNAEAIVPNEISDDKECTEIFHNMNAAAKTAYSRMTYILQNKYMIDDGMDESTAKKKAQENARAILPECTETAMIVTMNARELIHFFNLRCCGRAQDEIREVATQMFTLVYPIAPHLFSHSGPSCVATGKCPEGAKSCGRAKDMIEKFNKIKEEVTNGNTKI